MVKLDPQASVLNRQIRSTSPTVYDLLSRRGREIFFPKLGILSQSAQARGKEINATIGTALEENGETMRLPSLARQVEGLESRAFSYAPSYGRPEFRSLWQEHIARKNPSLDHSQIGLPVVTSALTHGLSMLAYLFVNPGDTIIMPDLFWENYSLVFNLACGSRFSLFAMFDAGGGFNIKGMRRKLVSAKPGKKIVLLNFPNNPTGYTPTVEEGKAIRDVVLEAAQARNDVLVLVDDAYFGLVYEKGVMTESIFALVANLHERVLAAKLDGPTKEDYAWGFRVGFITFGTKRNSPALYTALEAKLAGAIRGSISNASNLGQALLLKAYGGDNYGTEKAEKYSALKKRYDSIRQILETHTEYRPFFEALPFNSGYFMCVRIKSGKAEAVRQVLLSKYSTGLIAQGDLLRIAFSSTPRAMLEKLFGNVYDACRDVAPARAQKR